MNGGQAFAIKETIVADTGQAVRYGDRSQASAITESMVSDACHTIGNNQILYLFSIQEKVLGIIKWI